LAAHGNIQAVVEAEMAETKLSFFCICPTLAFANHSPLTGFNTLPTWHGSHHG